jgi:hypothetical protein
MVGCVKNIMIKAQTYHKKSMAMQRNVEMIITKPRKSRKMSFFTKTSAMT